jgi:hypothetical protein
VNTRRCATYRMTEAVGRDASTDSPENPPSFGASTRSKYSMTSVETGESSKANSIVNQPLDVTLDQSQASRPEALDTSIPAPAKDGRVSHRSHKSRSSGAFLLSNDIFEAPQDTNGSAKPSAELRTRRKEAVKDPKGKVVVRNAEKKHHKKRSSVGLGVGGSPLVMNVSHVGLDGNEPDTGNAEEMAKAAKTPSASLDVDSAQIVNLALNLSQSRQIAARRNISTPLPPTISGFGEGFAGGSLRQHLQQQRRSSRNISPKPDKWDRQTLTMTRMPQGSQVNSPLQAAFGNGQDGEYQYQFSASTLARAEKAKNAIELMAQYRKLLQYVPPLKPHPSSRSVTASPPASPATSSFPLSRTTSTSKSSRPLGRPYNPLQYIRNRKVRARERRAIDGEIQGFGDIESVTLWVDNVSRDAVGDEFQGADCVSLPALNPSSSEILPHTSSPSTHSRNASSIVKVRRPRVDWITNAPDMLADVYWLEQNDNKKSIEDRTGHKIFPQHVGLVRPTSRSEEPAQENPVSPGPTKNSPGLKLEVDTRLPQFQSVRSERDKESDSPLARARQKLHSASHINELKRIGHDHNILQLKSRSDSDSSETDSMPHRRARRRRSDMVGSHDVGSDVLAKQMREVMRKGAYDADWNRTYDMESDRIIQSIESAKPATSQILGDAGQATSTKVAPITKTKNAHRRTESTVRSDNSQPPSGRASLEVPGMRGRANSLEGLDWTAPNSPEAKAINKPNIFIPSIGMDLSPPRSRAPSPLRRDPFTRVKSRIHQLRDRSRDRSKDRSSRANSVDIEDFEPIAATIDLPSTPERAKRNTSPVKKIPTRKPDDTTRPVSVKSSTTRRRDEEPSGIRGLFKSGRSNVSKVSEFLWRKGGSPSSALDSDTSTDESDDDDEDDLDSDKAIVAKLSKSSSRNVSGDATAVNQNSSYELPKFVSSFEGRGRPLKIRGEEDSPESDYVSHRLKAREKRKASRFDLLKPPRIDVQNASPDSSADEIAASRSRSSRNSDVSDLGDIRRQSSAVSGADARLNAILSLQGPRKRIQTAPITGTLPITALADIAARRESSVSRHKWSISDCNRPVAGMTRGEIARIRALLLSSGIKSKEILRKSAEPYNIGRTVPHPGMDNSIYKDVAAMNRDSNLVLDKVPVSQAHILAARVLSNDIQLSSRMWQDSAETFSTTTITSLLDRVETLQDRILGKNGLSEVSQIAAREADELSSDLMTGQTLKVKALTEKMETMLRRRRRRLRWVRRGGWVALEWVLVGVMWWVWLVVVLVRVLKGIVDGVVGGVRWLFWL